MRRLRVAAIIFTFMLAAIFFHNIYTRAIRDQMVAQATELVQSEPSQERCEQALQTWKNRKRWLSLATPLTVLDQIDLQFAEMQASLQAKDDSAYVSACRRLLTLLSMLGR